MNEKILLKKFCIDRNIKKNTLKGYVSAIDKYVNFHEKTIDFLIEEAQKDEKNKTLLKTSTTKYMFYFQIKAHSFLTNFINKNKMNNF